MRSPRPAAALAVACLAAVLLASIVNRLKAQDAAQPAAQPAAAQQPAAQPAAAQQPAAQPAAAQQPATPTQTPTRPAPSDSIGSLVGANVTVYLRADAVGTHFNGSNMELKNLIVRRGAFVRVEGDWFVLRNEAQETWIPRNSIALVEMRS